MTDPKKLFDIKGNIMKTDVGNEQQHVICYLFDCNMKYFVTLKTS